MMLNAPQRFLRSAKRFFTLLIGAILRHRVIDLGAQLAYWSLLALFPFVIFLLTLIGYLPLGDVDQRLMAWAAPFMPEAALRLIWETVHEVLGRQRGGLLAASLLGGLWSASGGASALTVALNRAYGVEETRPYLRRKAEALLVTLAATALLIVAVVGATIGPGVLRWLLEFVGAQAGYGWLEETWRWLRWPATILALIGCLAAVYSLLPNVRHQLHLVSAGSIVAVLGWLLVTWAFGRFVTLFGNYARSYGALGAVVMLLTWIFLSGITVIVGAEVNAAWVRIREEREGGDPVT